MTELTLEEISKAIKLTKTRMAHQCHMVSLAIVQAKLFGPSRVARGSCLGVGGQHSWVIIGDDCYNTSAKIVDATLWSYDSSVKDVWYGSYEDGLHKPHGAGSIFDWGRPSSDGGEPIELDVPISQEAQAFLDLLGPLDYRGWSQLAHAPVGDWPAKEILSAMDQTKRLRAIIPIDILGMATDRNPSGLYM